MKLVKLLFVGMILISAVLGLSTTILAYEDDELPEVHIINSKDFRVDGQLAVQKQTPILVLFAMRGCTYCEYVEEEHLKPMLRNAKYRQKVIIRRVMTDDYGEITDFDGNKVKTSDFSTRYGAYLTPTVVFFDHNGKALSRILGVANTEFYGGDLDKSLDLSLKLVRKQLISMK